MASEKQQVSSGHKPDPRAVAAAEEFATGWNAHFRKESGLEGKMLAVHVRLLALCIHYHFEEKECGKLEEEI